MMVSNYQVPTVKKEEGKTDYVFRNTVFTNASNNGVSNKSTNASNNSVSNKSLTYPQVPFEKYKLEYKKKGYTCETRNANANAKSDMKIEVPLCLKALLEIEEYITKVGDQFIFNIEKLLK